MTKLQLAETKLDEAKRRLANLVTITNPRDLDCLKKTVENLNWAILFTEGYQSEINNLDDSTTF